ncbi:MAG TPA: hypothetical protein VFQ53_23220 [Kofleriaceae bacterium]|nr:hypothetical protein [Kofleriaceae bacterium]
MSSSRWLVLALVVSSACTEAWTRDPEVTEPIPPATSPPSDGGGAGCTIAPIGSELWRRELGPGAFGLNSDVAVDATGDPVVAMPLERHALIAKLTGASAPVWGKPFGGVLALDAEGNAYVAGGFRGTLDVGTGPMTAEGNIDTFLIKLDARGGIVFARALRLCGDGVSSIAVAADGRIAISGSALGTVVLDAGGRLLDQKQLSGDVAFDSRGNLIVGGSFSGSLYLGGGTTYTTPGDEDGFVVALGPAGEYLWSVQIGDPQLPVTLPGGVALDVRTRQAVRAVAVDRDDHVIVGGELDSAADVLGRVILSPVVDGVGLLESAFVVKLDAGAPQWVVPMNPVEDLDDIAVDARGNVLVSGAQHDASAASERGPMLIKLSPIGGVLFSQGIQEEGEGHGIAADACGAIFQSMSVRDGDDLVGVIRKVSL